MGYSPLLSGNNDPGNNGDLQEGFEFGYEALQGTGTNGTAVLGGKNVWPEELPAFREAALGY
jgi:isopenicillin N synthase-like dioxygenase